MNLTATTTLTASDGHGHTFTVNNRFGQALFSVVGSLVLDGEFAGATASRFDGEVLDSTDIVPVKGDPMGPLMRSVLAAARLGLAEMVAQGRITAAALA
jgi:hypothetical protein